MKRFGFLVCICGLMVVLAAGAGTAAPAVVLDGSPVYIDSAGLYQYNYIVTNYGGTQHINDLEVDASLCYGWVDMGGPYGWVTVLPITGPGARWSTEASDIDIDMEKSGFWLRAGKPDFYYGGCSFTYGPSHQVFATGTMAMPVPEPGSMLALGSGLIALAGSVLKKRR